MLPDAEILVRQWAIQVPALQALLDNGDGTYRVATDLPNSPVWPFLTVFRAAGAPDTDAELDIALMQWDCYAARGNTRPDHETSSLLARTLVQELRAAGGITIAGYGHIYGFTIIDGPRRIDEPTTGWARRKVDTFVAFREE